MSISKSKSSIEEAINKAMEEAKETELQDRADRLIKHINSTVISKDIDTRWPCAALVWALTGDSACRAADEIHEMKSTFTDLLVFLTDPEIAKRFEEVRRYCSKDFATHLRRVLTLLNDADKKEIFAEMAHFELSAFGHTEQQIENLESDFL